MAVLGRRGESSLEVRGPAPSFQKAKIVRILETPPKGSYLDYGGKELGGARQGRVGTSRAEGLRGVEREKGTPASREWGERDRYAVSPNQRGFDPGSLYDQNRWDPINLPLRGSHGLYCPSIHTIPLVRRGHGTR